MLSNVLLHDDYCVELFRISCPTLKKCPIIIELFVQFCETIEIMISYSMPWKKRDFILLYFHAYVIHDKLNCIYTKMSVSTSESFHKNTIRTQEKPPNST